MRQIKLLDMLDLEDPEFEAYSPVRHRKVHQPTLKHRPAEISPDVLEQDELANEIQFSYQASHHEED